MRPKLMKREESACRTLAFPLIPRARGYLFLVAHEPCDQLHSIMPLMVK